ncbi:MAG TPA: preprotein translocase subunit SecE [Rhizomicrobium sp.]|nr:preprotein translocase subunit SecE [Rhizomicrobium sp.]
MAEATKKTADTAGKDLPAPARRGGVIQFFREVQRETSKVTWPTWKETWLTTVMVFIMVGLMMLFFFAVDWLLAFGERWLIGALH